MEVKTVGVIGCGTMGAGICEVAARSGYPVVFVEVDQSRVDSGLERIQHSLDRAEKGGKISSEEKAEALQRISGSTKISDLEACDLAIEAIPEHLDIKKQLFAELDEVLPAHAILASNTSSLPIIEMGVATHRPNNVVGIHFFNPAPVMELVELVTTVTSLPESVETAKAFIESLGKTPVVCRDRAGFIANLLLFPYLNEAVKLLEAGFASREDLDAAMQLGAGHPIGPLALLDLVGLDSCAEILESLHRQFEESRYAPSPMFRHLVSAGYLGRKSGKGFYSYEAPDSPKVVDDDRQGVVVPLPEPTKEIKSVAVVGTGTMGSGIVEVAASSGLDVVCRGRSDESVGRARKAVEKTVARATEKGRMSADEGAGLLDRITWTTDLDAISEADLVIEVVAEDLDLKKELFGQIDKIAKEGAILGTGTSSLPVVEIASATTRPEQVLGVHFFNPAGLMKLVEIVRTVATSKQVIADAKAAVEAMGKHSVMCEDRAGFIVNRLLFGYLNDAIRTLQSGYATADDIDTSMKLGCGHPMGPFALIDLVGLDVTQEILRSLHAEFRDPAYEPADLLTYLVQAGHLGRKTGKGFFTY